MQGTALQGGVPNHHWWFCALFAATVVLGWHSLNMLVLLAIRDERYASVAAIPVASSALIYWMRRPIFRAAKWGLRMGALGLVTGIGIYVVGRSRAAEGENLSIAIAGIVVMWVAGFVICYGITSARAAMFPLSLLLLTIPLPGFVLDGTVLLLQKGSAAASLAMFHLIGVPVLRNGFVFSLPGLTIEVAEQCSGIRSAISLFIVTIIASRLFLLSPWERLFLVIVSIPIVIAKNALRIVVITWLGMHVHRDFLFGDLHRSSGIVFSPLALLGLGLVLWALRSRSGREVG